MQRSGCGLMTLLLAGAALADATLAKADIAGAKDSPLTGRTGEQGYAAVERVPKN